MKNLSIRLKITLWFSAFIVIIVSLTFIAILSVSNSVIQKTIRDGLVETVEDNVDEIEYLNRITDTNDDHDADHYIEYKNGYLEIDDDFLDIVNGISTALYQNDGTLLYGENPIAKATFDTTFCDSEIQRISVKGKTYYIFDRMLTESGTDGLWLRGIVCEDQGATQFSSIVSLSLIILPILLIFAVLGGYLIAGRTLKPVNEISKVASLIGQGDDLKKRIELGKGSDELHQLADTFNSMFERLHSAFEREKQFTSDVSHELRTPMSVIMAQCEYSLENSRSNDEYKNDIKVIQRQGRKMSKLISDILDFTRLEQKTDKYICEKIDLSNLVNSLCEDMAMIKENGIKVSWDVQDGIYFNGSYELLSRLLSNLISNAYRYGKSEGHTNVSLKQKDNKILLSVCDDGIGIEPDKLNKIFDRFYQADSSRSGKGTGLGLSMVREIAKFHNGKISVKSKLGEGSTFTLELIQNIK